MNRSLSRRNRGMILLQYFFQCLCVIKIAPDRDSDCLSTKTSNKPILPLRE